MKTLKYVLGIILLTGLLLYISSYDSITVGHFNSPAGESAYKEAYSKAMDLLPKPTNTYNIKTSVGTVRVYQFSYSKYPEKAPIVLLPGRASGTPMWLENIKDLVAERTVYSLDALGDAGWSVQTHPITNSADQALWVEETLDSLGLNQVNIAGHSFGGWLAANYSMYYPNRVKTLSLIEPVFVLQGLKFDVYIKSISASLKFLPQHWRDSMLKDFGGSDTLNPADPIYQMISNATQHFSSKLPLPDQLTDSQLQSLTMPVYVALGERSAMHHSNKAMEVAKRNIKDVLIKNWLGGSHSLPMEFPKAINAELLRFMYDNEGSMIQPRKNQTEKTTIFNRRQN
jgi:pimeloyl-ACP methyl ester carboxylesterase